MFRVRVGLWGKVASCIRCVASATCIRCVASASCIGIDVHAKIGVQIRCVGQVIVAPASRPVAYSLRKLGSGRKIEDCWKCSETLESLNICWNRCPFKNWGTNSLCRPSYCPSRLSSHGTWPMAYGLWSTRFGRKIEDCSKCSETSKSLNICWYRCACKIWDSNSLSRPRFCRSRLSSRGTWRFDD
jgi:hypothetical protein